MGSKDLEYQEAEVNYAHRVRQTVVPISEWGQPVGASIVTWSDPMAAGVHEFRHGRHGRLVGSESAQCAIFLEDRST